MGACISAVEQRQIAPKRPLYYQYAKKIMNKDDLEALQYFVNNAGEILVLSGERDEQRRLVHLLRNEFLNYSNLSFRTNLPLENLTLFSHSLIHMKVHPHYHVPLELTRMLLFERFNNLVITNSTPLVFADLLSVTCQVPDDHTFKKLDYISSALHKQLFYSYDLKTTVPVIQPVQFQFKRRFKRRRRRKMKEIVTAFLPSVLINIISSYQ